MTKEEILALEAGSGIDALIHSQVIRLGEGGLIVKYSTDLRWCYEMEEVLKLRGLAADYARKFAWVLPQCWDFDMIHADALTRCKAALLAVKGEKNV